MGRDYTPYCIIECTFILSDPRYKTLPASAAKLYLALWARAFQDRRETLPDWYDTGAMQEDSRLDARTIRKCVTILQQRCLISVGPKGAITVCGARSKGKRIKWKDGEVSGQVGGQLETTQASSKSKSKSKSKKERESKTEPVPKPPAAVFAVAAEISLDAGVLMNALKKGYPLNRCFAWMLCIRDRGNSIKDPPAYFVTCLKEGKWPAEKYAEQAKATLQLPTEDISAADCLKTMPREKSLHQKKQEALRDLEGEK